MNSMARKWMPPVFADFVNVRDVGMIQRGGGLGFALEAFHAAAILRHGGRKHFQRDVAVQARVGGEIDLTHAAFTQARDDAVVPDAVAAVQSWIHYHPDLIAVWCRRAGRGPRGSGCHPLRHRCARRCRSARPDGCAHWRGRCRSCARKALRDRIHFRL